MKNIYLQGIKYVGYVAAIITFVYLTLGNVVNVVNGGSILTNTLLIIVNYFLAVAVLVVFISVMVFIKRLGRAKTKI